MLDIQLKFAGMSDSQKIRMYIDSNAPVLDAEALFTDGTRQYRIPMEPEAFETVTLRFRTGKDNADRVYVIINNEKIRMEKEKSDYYFDYYKVDYALQDKPVEYYFRIRLGNQVCYYNSRGASKENNSYYNFNITPGYKTPDWAKGAVFYQIFVDRFYNGDASNDVETNEYCYIDEGTVKVDNWEKTPATMGVREFYGGDLKGVMDKLDYLQNLGVDVIYLNPIFVSPSNHKYDIQDYDYIDPHFGEIVKDEGTLLSPGDKDNTHASRYICRVTDKENLEASNQLFIELVEAIHAKGMKIVLDGVFNHCGSFNKWMDKEMIYKNQEGYEKGAYVDVNSPYRSFFKFDGDSNRFDGWWGHDTLPKMNYENSPALFDDIMRIAKKWVSPPYNIDGWRLDVAADLGHTPEYNHYFWKEFRRNVKEANPNAIILAEHYGDPSSWLKGGEWDTVMNYDAFMEPITWFLTGLEKHSDSFRGDLLGSADVFWSAMSHHMSRMNTQSLQVSMNELSNHDHSRFLTRTSRKVGRLDYMGAEAASQHINKGVMGIAVLMQMTWPGAPTVYYGDEAGVCGWTDPDNRRTYPWGKEDKELIELHRRLIHLHKKYPVFTHGSLRALYGSFQVLSYGRFDEKQKMIVVVNNGDSPAEIELPVWKIGVLDGDCMEQIIQTCQTGGYNGTKAWFYPQNGYLRITLPPISSIILRKI